MELNIYDIEELYKACIKNKHTRIIKSNRISSKSKKLQEIYNDIWRPHNLASILGKNYVLLLLDEFTRKSWIILLKSKIEFFNAFKLWLPRAEVCRDKLNCLQTNGREEFINIAFQSFWKESKIKISYATPYMHIENGLAE